ncbi:hypothetical protein MMC11_001596 [Xylographa trunciseda]|nr:hypothetical protein [Xylographa trunciseda]
MHESSPSNAKSAHAPDNHNKGTPTASPDLLSPDHSTSTSPSQVPFLKRKRGIDTFSSTVRNTKDSIFRFDRDILELEAEKAEQPKTKKTKLHNKKKIVTGPGEVEYYDAVCQVHVSADISLPRSRCKECRRVSRIIRKENDLYAAWLLFKHKGNKATVEGNNTMCRWRRTRRVLANFKIELVNARWAIQVRQPPLGSSRPGLAINSTRKSVRFDPACLTDQDRYRQRNSFKRKSRHYKPGKYSAPEGGSWENTSKPKSYLSAPMAKITRRVRLSELQMRELIEF